MKQFRILSMLAVSLFLFSFIGKAQNKTIADQIKQNSIEIYDFHTTNRCVTCKAIEANTKYTLDTYFQEEVKNGTITLKVVNIDKEENYALAEKFQAAGTSLFFNIISSGKEKQIDLTGFAFSYGKNKGLFSNKLKRKLEKQLENI
jgi:thiol:disulfide interchange protein